VETAARYGVRFLPARYEWWGICREPTRRVVHSLHERDEEDPDDRLLRRLGLDTPWRGLDAEALRQVMERYFEEMRSILERHGGTVEKFIGDAVMAAFGIPVAHEDDALRAVRAAADRRDELGSFASVFRDVAFARRSGGETRWARWHLGDAVSRGGHELDGQRGVAAAHAFSPRARRTRSSSRFTPEEGGLA
jgi:hypothetical protein